jgi:molecular chaperone Hsp33
MQDHLIRVVTRDGSLRAVAAVTTALVEETRRRQGTDPTATVALGRLVTGAALLGSLLKGRERLALTVEGNGPLRRLQAETDAAGQVRGAVKVPVSGLAPGPDGFDVAGAVGRAGFLHVVKDLGLKEPYRGMVELYTSTIAQDLAYYLTVSEQVPSSVALGVYVEPDGRVTAAGGFLVQSLPPRNEGLVSLVEERLAVLPPTTALLREGLAPADILARLLAGIPCQVVGQTELAFRCSCSREQVRGVLGSLGPEELQGLIAEGGAEVTCEFCKEVYRFSAGELGGLGGG